MLEGDVHYKLMRLLEANPQMSQRDAARELGVSLGKVNYCLRALVKKGWIKASHFKNSNNKAAYMYLLTPRGLEEKASLTVRFLQMKMQEYEALRTEIRQMRREAAAEGAQAARKLRKESSS
jgi:EPS-associated MarR family transcriptional regulator